MTASARGRLRLNVFDALPLSLPPAQLDALRLAYASPPRAYHNIAHVEAVLGHVGEVSAGPGWHQPAEVVLASLYHDAIYEPGRSDNETRSADHALQALTRWPPASHVALDRVVELIQLTARHGRLGVADVANDAAGGDARLFLDCDMAILGAEPAAFDAYDRAIAAEYRGRVPDWTYRLQRRRFLKTLLGRPRIFLSDFFHQRLDARARANLRRAVTVRR